MNTLPFSVLGAVQCALVLSILTTCAAQADEFVQHPPHEHGKVTINTALDGNELVIELDSPAMNVVGFEHEPHTDEEHVAAQAATTLLRNGRELLNMPREARCQFEKTELKAPEWEHSDEKAAPHDEHEHHADYHARFIYRCWSPDHLIWLQPALLDKLRNVTEARINIATATGQRSEVVTNGHARVALR